MRKRIILLDLQKHSLVFSGNAELLLFPFKKQRFSLRYVEKKEISPAIPGTPGYCCWLFLLKKDVQPNLFENAESRASQNILRIRENKETLSASQAEYNRLLKKLETAETKIVKTRKALEKKLAFTMQELYPLVEKINRQDMEKVRLLFEFYRDNKLSNQKSEHVVDIIRNLVDGIFASPVEISEADRMELEKTMNAVYPGGKEALEKEESEDFEARKELLADFLFANGIQVNLEGLHKDMDEAELNAYFEKIKDETEAANNWQEKPRKKTKRQVEAEQRRKEAENLKDRSLKIIYTELAKLIHPDRETDEALRMEKEEWMKMLTVAYQERNIKTMLEIQAKWINGAQKKLSNTPDETIQMYCILLKEQIQELGQENNLLGNEPRYAPMHPFIGSAQPIHWKPEYKKRVLEDEIARQESELAALRKKGKAARNAVDRMIREEQDNYTSFPYFMD